MTKISKFQKSLINQYPAKKLIYIKFFVFLNH
nr:MAG TPA: hypothetical protein [Caudoviricetes sp.]